MKPEQNYFLLGSEDPIRVRLTGVRKPPVIRRTSGNRSAEVDYYTTLLIEHLQEYFPGEMLLLKDLRARARIAYKESVRTNVPIADALANALRYLFFGFETSGFERLKSEIWMQGYYSQANNRPTYRAAGSRPANLCGRIVAAMPRIFGEVPDHKGPGNPDRPLWHPGDRRRIPETQVGHIVPARV